MPFIMVRPIKWKWSAKRLQVAWWSFRSLTMARAFRGIKKSSASFLIGRRRTSTTAFLDNSSTLTKEKKRKKNQKQKMSSWIYSCVIYTSSQWEMIPAWYQSDFDSKSTGCWNVSFRYQRSYSGIHSLRWSYSLKIDRNADPPSPHVPWKTAVWIPANSYYMCCVELGNKGPMIYGFGRSEICRLCHTDKLQKERNSYPWLPLPEWFGHVQAWGSDQTVN